MIARTGSGWQVTLADLSLILFIIAASALTQAQKGRAAVAQSPRGEPVSVWTSGKDAPPIGQWLAAQPADPRAVLTITVHYTADGRAAALGTAEIMAQDAGRAGRTARVVVEPGEQAEASAVLAYDAALAHQAGPVARDLLGDPPQP